MSSSKSTRRDAYPHLSDAQYHTLISRGTEEPGTSSGTLSNKPDQVYSCPNCQNELFSAMTKFASGTGWPSFYAALGVVEKRDWRLFEGGKYMGLRKEVICSKCKGHLGHVFRGENWDTPSGIRYCINSSSITIDQP